MNLSEYSSDVVGFDSTWDSDKQVHVRDTGTEPMESQTEVSHKNVGTSETREFGVQAAPFVTSNSNEETDKKLAAWLRRIMPALERELAEGVTQVHESSTKVAAADSFAQVSQYQQIDVKSHFPRGSEDAICGVGVWLSIVIQNSPALVLSCSPKMGSSESPSSTTSSLILFEPQRSKADGKIYWQEASLRKLDKPIHHLAVNSENRDMFAGSSSTGELFIWTYLKQTSSSGEPRIAEIFSRASEDSILAITFLNDSTLLSCHTDGSIIAYKILNKQSCIVDKVMKIDQRRVKDSQITAITNLLGSASSDFIIGFLNGKIFYCSMNQFTPQEDSSPMDPITRELHAHKFAVKSLKHCRHAGKNLLVSFDASSEIFIHEIDDDPNEKSLKYVIRLPLPIKNSMSLTASIEHIFCPLSNGSLEVFNARNNSRRTIDDGGGHLSGTNALSELSKNESWLLTGIFDGIIKIYHVSIDSNE